MLSRHIVLAVVVYAALAVTVATAQAPTTAETPKEAVASAVTAFAQAEATRTAGKYPEAVDAYRRSEKLLLEVKEDPQAAACLAQMYDKDQSVARGVLRDSQKAIRFHEVAARGGNVDAMLAVASHFSRRQHRDEEVARKFRKMAFDQSIKEALPPGGGVAADGAAMVRLAWMYRHGHGVEADVQAAREWLTAADLTLELEFAFGDDKAAGWRFEAAFPDVRAALGLPRDDVSYWKWRRIAALAGDTGAMLSLHSELASSDSEEDRREAEMWLLKAAHCGSIRSMVELGRRDASSTRWLELAAQVGDADALKLLEQRKHTPATSREDPARPAGAEISEPLDRQPPAPPGKAPPATPSPPPPKAAP